MATSEDGKKKGGCLKVFLIVLVVLIVIIAIGAAVVLKSAKEAMKEADDQRALLLGEQAPDFTVETTDGTEVQLSKLLEEKNAVVLNIFTTWCGPCEKEFPEMEEVYQQYKDKLEIVAASGSTLDDMDAVKEYQNSHKLSFKMGLANESLDFVNATAYPTTLIIDRDGRIGFMQAGAFQTKSDFEELVKRFTADDYQTITPGLYSFITYCDQDPVKGVEIKLTSDTVNETLTTDKDGQASILIDEAQELNVEVVSVPDGYKLKGSEQFTIGKNSEFSAIVFEKK